jgi:acyl-CoA hydrolase
MQIYRDAYLRKLTTAEEAIGCVKDGDNIVHGVTIAEPPALLRAIADRARSSHTLFLVFRHAGKMASKRAGDKSMETKQEIGMPCGVLIMPPPEE